MTQLTNFNAINFIYLFTVSCFLNTSFVIYNDFTKIISQHFLILFNCAVLRFRKKNMHTLHNTHTNCYASITMNANCDPFVVTTKNGSVSKLIMTLQNPLRIIHLVTIKNTYLILSCILCKTSS